MTIKWCIIHEIWSATEFLIIFGHFLPFYPPNSLQNENTKKMKKCLEISSFYTSVPKIMIVGYTVPEISHKAERIIFHFGQFFALLRLKNEKNTWRYHHFTQCTINDSHMVYGFWDMQCSRQNFFVILGHCLPFYSPNSPKNEHFKKMKKNLEISSFNTNVPKIIILCFTFLEIWCVTNVIIFHFGLFFALLPLQQHKKSKFLKNEKNTWRYHHFTHIYQLIRWCMVPKIWCAMNGRTEKVT